MELANTLQTKRTHSNSSLLVGRIINILCVLFLLFDAVMKLILESHSIKGSIDLGWPEANIQLLGAILLVCTLFYIIPRTAFFGAILLTGYLGGAIAIMLRVGQPYYFPVIFGILVWVSLYLRNERLRFLVNPGKNN